MINSGPMIMPEDVVLVPVAELPDGVRQQLQAEAGDYAVTRRNTRTPSRIIDADSAALLQVFRTPSTIVEAVIQYSRERSSDPEQTLEEAYPMLERLASAQVLVPVDADDAVPIEKTLATGARWGSFDVVQCIQSLEDTELYRVRTSEGQDAALKILRPNAGAETVRMFDREAAILTLLDGAAAPKLLAEGTLDDRRYLLLEWCSGVDCATAAADCRRLTGSEGRRRIIRLCTDILDAYARLHERNVVHSDVHPRNILVGSSGVIKLIDFGLARIPGTEGEFRRAPRGGVAFFFESEYARAIRAHKGPPYSSFLGEQYGLGALLYFLVTGAHYLDFSVEKHEMLRQIAEDTPLTFAQRGIDPWPELEPVLAKALSKTPSDRFSSVSEFARAVEAAAATLGEEIAEPPGPVPFSEAQTLVAKLISRLAASRPLFERGLEASPKVSVTYGSAGVAYGLYRVACAREDSELLALADLWAARACRDIGLTDAFYSENIEITLDIVGKISPYHTATGVHVTQALVAAALGDMATQQIALDNFLAAAEAAPCETLDVTLGQAGILLAAARLLDSVKGDPYVNSTALVTFGNRKLTEFWARIDALAPIRECREISYTGAAHGWAGILFAVMNWCQSSGTAPPGNLKTRLDQLAKMTEYAGRRAHWRYTVRRHRHEDGPGYMPGWCNGTAGFVFSWILASELLRKPEYAKLAEAAGVDVWESENHIGNLCCGYAGQAYALLALHRHTGDKLWFHRAQAQAERAARAILDMPAQGAYYELAIRAESLYKGELGVAVLAAELDRPQTASMPFFDKEP